MARKKAKHRKRRITIRRKKTIEHKEDDSNVFVKMDSPIATRKEILRTAIDSAELLKAWESYKKIRFQKEEHFRKLVLTLKRIEREINSLKRSIPKIKGSESLEEVEKDITTKEAKRIRADVPRLKIEDKAFKSGIDKEIQEIKKKLDSLGV